MTALTPDCDPDLHRGPSRGSGSSRPGALATLVVAAFLAGSVLVVASTGPGVVAFLAAVVALLSAVSTGRRAVRLVRAGLPVAAERRARTASAPRSLRTSAVG